jgi:hypothetical protein
MTDLNPSSHLMPMLRRRMIIIETFDAGCQPRYAPALTSAHGGRHRVRRRVGAS